MANLRKVIDFLNKSDNMTLLEETMSELRREISLQVWLDFVTKMNIYFNEIAPDIVNVFSSPFVAEVPGKDKHIVKRLEQLHRKYANVVSVYSSMMSRPLGHKALMTSKSPLNTELNLYVIRNDTQSFSFTVFPHELPHMFNQLIEAYVRNIDKSQIDDSTRSALERSINKLQNVIADHEE